MKKTNRNLAGKGLNDRIKKAGLNLEGGKEVEELKEKTVADVVADTKKSLELLTQEKEAAKAGAKIADALGLNDKKEEVEDKKEYVFCIAEHVPSMIISSTKGGEELKVTESNIFCNRVINRLVKQSRTLFGLSLYKAPFRKAIERLLEDIKNGELRLFSEDGFIYSSYKGSEPVLLIGSGNLVLAEEEFEDFDTATRGVKINTSVEIADLKFLDLL